MKSKWLSGLIIGSAMFGAVTKAPAQSNDRASDKFIPNYFNLNFENIQPFASDTTFFYSDSLHHIMADSKGLPDRDELVRLNGVYGDRDSLVPRTSYEQPLTGEYVGIKSSIPFAFNQYAISYRPRPTDHVIDTLPEATDYTREHDAEHIVLINMKDHSGIVDGRYNTAAKILLKDIKKKDISVIGDNRQGVSIENINKDLEDIRKKHDRILVVVNGHGRVDEGRADLIIGGIGMDELVDVLAKQEFELSDVMLNACYSGYAADKRYANRLSKDSQIIGITSENHFGFRPATYETSRAIKKAYLEGREYNMAAIFLGRPVNHAEQRDDYMLAAPFRMAVSQKPEMVNPELSLAVMLGQEFSDNARDLLYNRCKDEMPISKTELNGFLDFIECANEITDIPPEIMPVAFGVASHFHGDFKK